MVNLDTYPHWLFPKRDEFGRRVNYKPKTESRSSRRRKHFFMSYEDKCCLYCAEPLSLETFTIDHVIPRSKGGGNSRFNKVLACLHCNTSRADMSFLEFLEFIGWDMKAWLARRNTAPRAHSAPPADAPRSAPQAAPPDTP